MMNISRKILLASAAAIGVAAVASSAFAQNSASNSATASVTIIRPITIAPGSALNFGRVVVNNPANPGSLVISPAGVASSLTNVTAVAGNTVSGSSFTIGGEGGQAYTASLPTSVSLAGVATPANTVTVDTFTDASANSFTLTGSLGSAGSDTLTVGAKLTIPASTAADTYRGTYTVTVTYN